MSRKLSIALLALVSSMFSGFLYAQQAPSVAESPAPAQPTATAANLTVPVAQPAATVAQPPAPTRIIPGAKVFIEDQGEFGMALAASFIEKKVPVSVVRNSEKADFTLKSVSHDRRAGGAEKVTRLLVGAWGGGDRYHAVVEITNRDGVVVFAYNVKKGNFQDAANSTANEIKNKGLQKS
jgi:hypothetical protein